MSKVSPPCFRDIQFFRLLQVPLTASLSNLEKACTHLETAVQTGMNKVPHHVLQEVKRWIRILQEERAGYFTANTDRNYEIDCKQRNLYDILNVDPHATHGEIYRAFARTQFWGLYGPGHDHPAMVAFSKEDLGDVYKTLLDPLLRESYHFRTYDEIIDGNSGKVVVSDF